MMLTLPEREEIRAEMQGDVNLRRILAQLENEEDATEANKMVRKKCFVSRYRITEIETPFGKRILIKKRKIKEQMKIILAQYFEIFQISSSGKMFNKNIME